MTTDNLQSMMADFLKSAQKMQAAFKDANPGGMQVDHNKTVMGKAGAGDLTVQAEVNLKLHVKEIQFSDNLLAQEKNVAQELVTAAVNDAIQRAQSTLQQEMMQMTKNMGFPHSQGTTVKE